MVRRICILWLGVEGLKVPSQISSQWLLPAFLGYQSQVLGSAVLESGIFVVSTCWGYLELCDTNPTGYEERLVLKQHEVIHY